jgi:hypothetical protein
MITPQSPSLQVFVPIERVSRADMASQCLAAIATIQANHIIVVNGSPHRYSRYENFLCLNGLSEVTQRVMDCGDQVRKLLWSQRVVPNVLLTIIAVECGLVSSVFTIIPLLNHGYHG